MKQLIGLILIVGLTIWLGCESSPLVTKTGEQFDLKYGQTVFVSGPDVRLTFTGDVFDNRCCNLCLCIWPGYASISLDLQKDGKTSRINLATQVYGPSVPPSFVDTLGYRFSLEDLQPYPQDTDSIPNAAYTASLKVIAIPDTGSSAEVIITDTPPSAIIDEPYGLDSGRVEGDRLRLWIHHGGGCQKHYYQLYMSPGSFFDGPIKQANLYLKHFGPPDYCEALLYVELEFGLQPILDLYYNQVSGGGGEVNLIMTDCVELQLDPPCLLLLNDTLVVPSLPD